MCYHIFVYVWPTSLIIMICRSIYDAANGVISFFLWLSNIPRQWIFRLFPCLGYFKQCYGEYQGVYIFSNYGFLQIDICPEQIYAHELYGSFVFSFYLFFFLFFIFFFYFQTLHNCISFAKYHNESTTGIHVFPILNPPPSSLPIPSLWVVSVHQPQASSIVHRTWTGNSFHT